VALICPDTFSKTTACTYLWICVDIFCSHADFSYKCVFCLTTFVWNLVLIYSITVWCSINSYCYLSTNEVCRITVNAELRGMSEGRFNAVFQLGCYFILEGEWGSHQNFE
jgi:hypothetical protein